MANSKSALKRVRQNTVRTERNKTTRTRMKSLRKKTLDAAKEGKAEEAQANLKELSSAIDRALKNNVIHKNKAANLKSKAVKALRSATS